jgi:hypothetical protein
VNLQEKSLRKRDPKSLLNQQVIMPSGIADAMFSIGRYFYAVFMCHLSIEKSLKGLYSKKLHEVPPKTHNLIYLLNKIGKKPDQKLEKFFLWFFRFSRTRQFML